MSTSYNGKPESHRGLTGIHMERKTWKFPHQYHLPVMPSVLFFKGNFTPKTSNYRPKDRALGFPGIYQTKKKQCPNFHCLETGFLSGIFRNPLRLMIFSVRPGWRSLQKSILDTPLAFSRREVFNPKWTYLN